MDDPVAAAVVVEGQGVPVPVLLITVGTDMFVVADEVKNPDDRLWLLLFLLLLLPTMLLNIRSGTVGPPSMFVFSLVLPFLAFSINWFLP